LNETIPSPLARHKSLAGFVGFRRAVWRKESTTRRSFVATLLRMTLFYFLLTLSLYSRPIFAEEIPERIDGTVISVDEKSRLLRVDFEHPATFERSQLEFNVSESAGFKDFKKLTDLKKGDLVSLDYLNYGKTLKAIYIIHVPREKIFFTTKEITDALVKMKSSQNHEKNQNQN